MEGLIPFIYRVIIQYRGSGRRTTMADSWFSESPPMPYIRLPGDSGRFTLRPEYVFSSSPTSSSPISSCSIASTGSPLPLRFSSSRPAYSCISKQFHIFSALLRVLKKHTCSLVQTRSSTVISDATSLSINCFAGALVLVGAPCCGSHTDYLSSTDNDPSE